MICKSGSRANPIVGSADLFINPSKDGDKAVADGFIAGKRIKRRELV